jgi:HK97 gp10 family phage protein
MPKRPRVKGMSFGRGYKSRSLARGAHVTAKLTIDPASWQELKRKLEALKDELSKRAIQEEAVLAGAGIIREEADKHAPGPHIVAEIVERADLPDVVTAGVGPDKKHWYYRFAETGATPHEIKAAGGAIVFYGNQATPFVGKGAQNTGGMPAKPFLRPAVENKGTDAIDAMGNVLRKGIERAVK